MRLLFITLYFMVTFAMAQTDADKKAVEQACLDYVEAIYEVKPERIDRGVDVTLRKWGYWYNAQRNAWSSGSEMNFKQLRALAERWNSKGNQDTSIKTIKILDMESRTAVAKLYANWGVDYFHLVKEGDTWKIINIVWQSIEKQQN